MFVKKKKSALRLIFGVQREIITRVMGAHQPWPQGRTIYLEKWMGNVFFCNISFEVHFMPSTCLII